MHRIIENETQLLTDTFNFNKLKNKKILITGASGLIGVYLSSCLNNLQEKLDLEFYCWTNSPIDEEFKKLYKNANFVCGDITDIRIFQKLPEFDIIIHAAGYGQPNRFLEDKTKTIELNTTSTINLFKKLKRDGTFLFVSTSELYSGLDITNLSEDMIGNTNTNHPRASYIEGKRCGEAICYSFIDKGYDVKIARLSLAYGPGTKKDDQRVLNSLIQKGLFNETINLMDNGDAIRTYCYITDVIEIFWNILLNGKDVCYNVGGESITTILDLAKLIGQKLNKDVVTPELTNELAGNPKVVNISTEKYKNEFNKTSFISLEDGIINTINWQKELYGKNK